MQKNEIKNIEKIPDSAVKELSYKSFSTSKILNTSKKNLFFLPKLKALMHFKRFIQLFSPKSFVFLQAENYKNLQYEKTFSDYYLCTRCIIK